MITTKFKPILAIALLGLIFGCAKSKVEGKKVVMIIASQSFRDEELETPKSVFEKQGAKVTIASSSLDTATGMLGAKVKPDMLISDINVADYDAIVFVGGSGATEHFDDSTAHKVARKAVEQNKILCAMCIAPAILANAGVLEGRKVTASVYADVYANLNEVTYTGADCQVDGNIITARGPETREKFAKAIVKALAAK